MATDLGALGAPMAAYTSEYTFIRGEFDVGEDRLPYYSVAMPVGDASQFLVLPRDIVIDPTQPIGLEELFQRDLDEERVNSKIVPYLRQANRIKFFNSVTVAILPVDPESDNRLADAFPAEDKDAPSPADDGLETVTVGPVRIRQLPGNPGVGRISWNPKKARAVIVDGQHRVFALRQLLDRPDYPHKASVRASGLPVIFLVLDQRTGYSPSDPIGTSVLRTMRSIFVDLNKHAVPVTKTRNILLDDRDLGAVAMRVVLSDISQTDTPQRLPLALVDWYSESAKFDTGPHLTTVLVLYELVRIALQLPIYKEDDYEQVDRFLSTLASRLKLESRGDGSYHRRLREWRLRCEDQEVPFGLREDDIVECASAFRDVLGPLVVYPLLLISPYRELCERYQAEGFLDGKFEQWLALDRNGKSAFVSQAEFDPRDNALTIWNEVKSGNYAYQVVFQKAFITSLVEIDNVRELLPEDWGLSNPTRIDFITAWIDRFNDRIGHELETSFCWEGAGIRPDGTIAWTEASQRAIAGFVTTVLMAPMTTWDDDRDGQSFIRQAQSWLKEQVWDQIRQGRNPDRVEGLLTSQSRYWRDQVRRYVSDQARARGEPIDADTRDRQAVEHASERLAHIARRLRGI